jgi:hypothetical protein
VKNATHFEEPFWCSNYNKPGQRKSECIKIKEKKTKKPTSKKGELTLLIAFLPKHGFKQVIYWVWCDSSYDSEERPVAEFWCVNRNKSDSCKLLYFPRSLSYCCFLIGLPTKILYEFTVSLIWTTYDSS